MLHPRVDQAHQVGDRDQQPQQRVGERALHRPEPPGRGLEHEVDDPELDPQGRQIMLGLIQDLARAGISVLLSSHLLPDVERVCKRVVIMGGGDVLATGDIDKMQRPHPTLYTIDYSGAGDRFFPMKYLSDYKLLHTTYPIVRDGRKFFVELYELPSMGKW